MNKKRWKFLRDGMKSESGNETWKIGEWKHFAGELSLCHAGFHCSPGVWQAFSYVQSEILARVEVKGKSVGDYDKEAWSDMRVIEAYKWTKKDSVSLAIYAAELVIGNFEKEYPNDTRPREAIEAAKRYLKNPTKQNLKAAWSAYSAADLAPAYLETKLAATAAYLAAWSKARSEAWLAESAARSAAWSDVLVSASFAASKSEAIQKIATWMEKRVKQLEKI